ncbi:MAG: hypothetical protein RI571_08700 [Roseovarius sp.]|nr:hypothetical protein [Roseovarius sp.]
MFHAALRVMIVLPLSGLLALAGCAGGPGAGPATQPAGVTQGVGADASVGLAAQSRDRDAQAGQVARLEQAILALGPGVDPEEAARAARSAYRNTRELARAYQITDGPLLHNTKVNMGLKPRGLCWHWAMDMEDRLDRERFRTLEIHRAIANFNTPFRLQHSTAIISRRGDSMYEGIVLDPWREGGELTWLPTGQDTRYDWYPRLPVLAFKRGEMTAAELYAGTES